MQRQEAGAAPRQRQASLDEFRTNGRQQQLGRGTGRFAKALPSEVARKWVF